MMLLSGGGWLSANPQRGTGAWETMPTSQPVDASPLQPLGVSSFGRSVLCEGAGSARASSISRYARQGLCRSASAVRENRTGPTRFCFAGHRINRPYRRTPAENVPRRTAGVHGRGCGTVGANNGAVAAKRGSTLAGSQIRRPLLTSRGFQRQLTSAVLGKQGKASRVWRVSVPRSDSLISERRRLRKHCPQGGPVAGLVSWENL